MADDNLINISVEFAGRKYPLLITKQEEESVQLISQQLNKEFLDLHQRYANKLNKQDILAMLLLTYAKNLHEEKQKNNFDTLEQKVQSIENLLEKF